MWHPLPARSLNCSSGRTEHTHRCYAIRHTRFPLYPTLYVRTVNGNYTVDQLTQDSRFSMWVTIVVQWFGVTTVKPKVKEYHERKVNNKMRKRKDAEILCLSFEVIRSIPHCQHEVTEHGIFGKLPVALSYGRGRQVAEQGQLVLVEVLQQLRSNCERWMVGLPNARDNVCVCVYVRGGREVCGVRKEPLKNWHKYNGCYYYYCCFVGHVVIVLVLMRKGRTRRRRDLQILRTHYITMTNGDNIGRIFTA